MAAQLRDRHFRVRFFDYSDAEVLTERLAALLLDRLGRAEIEQRYFVPVPRGGLIVLGILAYALQLKPDQLPPAGRKGREAVVVDDVALTGHSLIQSLEGSGSETVVALLAAQPEIRRALEDHENVATGIAAVDLGSVLDDVPEEVASEWRANWEERLPGRPLAGSYPEPIAFPWSEPDSLLWDESTGRVEGGWQLVSPERSLKSRAALGRPSPDRASRKWQFPDDIAFGRFDEGALLVCQTTTEEVFRLDPVAAEIWGSLGTLGDAEAAVGHLLTRFETSTETLVSDVNSLAEQFLATGLLVPNPNP